MSELYWIALSGVAIIIVLGIIVIERLKMMYRVMKDIRQDVSDIHIKVDYEIKQQIEWRKNNA